MCGNAREPRGSERGIAWHIKSLNLIGGAFWFRAASSFCSGPGKLAFSFGGFAIASAITKPLVSEIAVQNMNSNDSDGAIREGEPPIIPRSRRISQDHASRCRRES